MKQLLEQDFICHYNRHQDLPVSVVVTQQTTNTEDFELNDDDVMVYSSGQGVAKFKNPTFQTVNVINYESFVNSLPKRVKNTDSIGKDICDLIVYTDKYLLLNELTDTNAQYNAKKRVKAQLQLQQSLHNLMNVQSILVFVNNHNVRHCCFFNKQKVAVFQGVIAPNAFNRQNTYSNGFKTQNHAIENYDFEFWEFYGNQTYLLSSGKVNQPRALRS
jgi:hypothetical protein